MASYFAGTIERSAGYEDCDDLRVIRRALLDMHAARESGADRPVTIDVHASGTAFRFVTAAAASAPGRFIVTGSLRLCSRPMEPMIDVLRQAGARIEGMGADGKGPYLVEGSTPAGGSFEIRGDVSSQFISALMLAAPVWKEGMRLRFTTPPVSRPYLRMTARVMESFGIGVSLSDTGVTVSPGHYTEPAHFTPEADWSAAGFFYEAASFLSRPVLLGALLPPDESMQGDSATALIFRKLGVSTSFHDGYASVCLCDELPARLETDLSDTPDLAPALAVACAINNVRFLFTGVRNLRVKECDRLAAIQAELGKFGYRLTVGDDSIEWRGDTVSMPDTFTIDTYDDHRIAMAFAMTALKTGEVVIRHPEVVDKSFSSFWERLPMLGLECRREDDAMRVVRSGQ